MVPAASPAAAAERAAPITASASLIWSGMPGTGVDGSGGAGSSWTISGGCHGPRRGNSI